MNVDSLMNDLATFGFMFESMVERDLAFMHRVWTDR